MSNFVLCIWKGYDFLAKYEKVKRNKPKDEISIFRIPTSLYLQPLLKLVYKSNIYSRNGWRYRRRTMCSGQVYRQNTSGERMNLAYHIQKSWHVSAALHQISILISHNYLLGFSLIIIDVYWEDFNFPIVNFSLICSTIPAAPAYGAYSSQLIRYSRACGSYQDSLIEECC